MKNKILAIVSVFFMLAILSITVFDRTVKYMDNIMTQETRQLVKSELKCMAENIYFEAGTESFEGKLSVGQVVINRTNHPSYPSTICGVVYQKQNGVCQFSWVCEPRKTSIDKYRWEESYIVAKQLLTNEIQHDIIKNRNVLFYHADYVSPNWNMNRVTKIGAHIFYAKDRT
jgi:spore germination cell wall hydrolase CwlJ-like protein